MTLLLNTMEAAKAYQITFFAAGACEILCALLTLPHLLKLKASEKTR